MGLEFKRGNMMRNIFMIGAACFVLAACSGNNDEISSTAATSSEAGAELAWDAVDNVFYNEFIPCTAGPDFSQVTVDEMVGEWRANGLHLDLLGAWGYAPASEDNQFDNGWWELGWASKAEADAAWGQWAEMDNAAAWAAKYENVMVCDGEGRFGWDFKFYRAPDSFGPTPESGEFASAFMACSFNEDKGFDDLDASISMYNTWLDSLDADSINFYAYGIYSAVPGTDTDGVDYFWGNFHESFDSMKAGSEGFEATGGDVMAAFGEVATCRNADIYNSKVFFDPTNPDFS
jgi:hypothetical protein